MTDNLGDFETTDDIENFVQKSFKSSRICSKLRTVIALKSCFVNTHQFWYGPTIVENFIEFFNAFLRG